MRSTTPLFLIALSVFAAGCSCASKPAAPSLLHEGEPCENDERCTTGLCDAAPGFSPVCVRRCADGCTPTEVCVQLTPNRFACQPDQRRLCQPCEADSDCPYPSDKCLSVNGEKVCGRDCAFDQYCPTGYRCVNGVGVDGQSKVQQCVPTNASCSCLARGDFQQACTTVNTVGTCTGIKQCDLVSNSVVCDAPQAVAETCNGKDDDCDGQVDEELLSTTCGVGACERTVSSCVDGGVANCLPGVPSTERCNAIDDDCDGTVDDGFDTMTDVTNCGSCGNACALAHTSQSCVGGACKVGTCAMGYANCDAMDPNGCEVNTQTDAMNCGGCGQTCTRPNSTATCVGGGCQFACAAGFIDLNQDPVDGCEYACTPTSATDLPDLLFVDANCDGIDGELSNGVFVSTTGNDSNLGTRASPKLTIAAAVSAAATNGKRDVYIAAGTYAGPLSLSGTAGVNIAGGYHAATWQRALANQVIVAGGNPALNLDSTSNLLVQALRFEGANGTAAAPTAYGARVVESTGVKFESLDIRAGNGRAGTDGTAGVTGTVGGTGSAGEIGCAQDLRGGDFSTFCNFGFLITACSRRPVGGAGGLTSCGFPGGQGGQPSRQTSGSYPSSTVVAGDWGFGAPNGTGDGGVGVPESASPSAGSSYFGGPGANGADGTNGAGGLAGGFDAGVFVAGNGGAGTPGTAGRGGGGGGGGAGGWIPWTGLPTLGNPCQGYGSAGGGGGAGGCQGSGAAGGEGGGASIGVLLFNSTVSAQGVVVTSGNGGNGGNGGTGGSGGLGGNGGTSPTPGDASLATRGGNGGAGGRGGRGGHGGGGAGGNVYGVARNTGSTWNAISGTQLNVGTPGMGGTSPGGNGGAAGVSRTTGTY